MQLNMTICKTGTWTSYWGYIDGLKEGNNSGFSNCDDLHAGWWVLCEGKHECFLFLCVFFFLTYQACKVGSQNLHLLSSI
jgi:hypothetical protein